MAPHGTLALVFVLALFSAACDSDKTSDGAPACAVVESGRVEGSSPAVIVRGDDPPCTVVFTPVVDLESRGDEPLPKPPVVAAPGGRWLTATYEEGRVALWSTSGRFEKLIGLGPGGGPGQFGTVSDLVVDSAAGELYVLTSRPAADVFSIDGDFLRRVNLPDIAHSGASVEDGTIVISGRYRIVLFDRDTAFALGPPLRGPMPAQMRRDDEGVWSGESQWYQIDHRALPDGKVDLSFRREVDWFPRISDVEALAAPGPLLLGFTLDSGEELMFARVLQVKDPNAPAGSLRLGGGGDREEANRRYFDGIIEAFSFDGRLIAATRFDSGLTSPIPLDGGATGNLWYRMKGDLKQSIEVLRAELVETQAPN